VVLASAAPWCHERDPSWYSVTGVCMGCLPLGARDVVGVLAPARRRFAEAFCIWTLAAGGCPGIHTATKPSETNRNRPHAVTEWVPEAEVVVESTAIPTALLRRIEVILPEPRGGVVVRWGTKLGYGLRGNVTLLVSYSRRSVPTLASGIGDIAYRTWWGYGLVRLQDDDVSLTGVVEIDDDGSLEERVHTEFDLDGDDRNDIVVAYSRNGMLGTEVGFIALPSSTAGALMHVGLESDRPGSEEACSIVVDSACWLDGEPPMLVAVQEVRRGNEALESILIAVSLLPATKVVRFQHVEARVLRKFQALWDVEQYRSRSKVAFGLNVETFSSCPMAPEFIVPVRVANDRFEYLLLGDIVRREHPGITTAVPLSVAQVGDVVRSYDGRESVTSPGQAIPRDWCQP